MQADVVAPAIRRRIITTIFVVSSLIAAAQIAYFTLSTIIAVDLSGRESLAGIPSTLSMVGRAVAAYPIGWLMGRAGRRMGLSLGLALGIVGMLLSTWAIGVGSFWAFSLGSGLAGVARGAVDLGRYAAADVNPPDKRARALGIVVFAGTIGAIVGPLMVSPSMRLAGLQGFVADAGPYLFGALLSAISLVLILVFLRPDPLYLSKLYDVDVKGADDAPATSVGHNRPLSQLLAQGHVRLGVAAMTIGQLVMVMIMVITPLHMSHGGHGTQAISMVIMAHTIGMFGLSGLSGWLIDRVGPAIVVIGGAATLIAASIMSPLTVTVAGLAMALFLLGLGWNFCFVAGSALLSSGLETGERGRVQGASDTLASAAAALGSLSTGPLFAYGELLLVSAVGLALSLGLLAAAFLQNQRRALDARLTN